MKASQYKRIRTLSIKLDKLIKEIENTKYDCELSFGYGLESEQLGCAVAALECILQETDY